MNVYAEVRAMAKMPMADLRARYADLFGEQTRSCNRDYLVRRIAWRMQALREGDLTERARKRARELARDADIRVRPPKDQGATPLASELRTVTGRLVVARDELIPPRSRFAPPHHPNLQPPNRHPNSQSPAASRSGLNNRPCT